MRAFLDELCGRYARDRNFSGVCRFEQGGEVLFERAYGFANRAFRAPNTPETMFDTASITKVFTAAAVLQLVEGGAFRLEDRIVELCDLSGTRIPSDVTVEQLLNHTSGIADDADEEAGEEYAALFVDSPNYAVRECGDFLKNFAWKEPNFPAGTSVRYCNCSFVLLGLAIERAAGMPYRDYVREHIFIPAGMSRSAFCAMDEINENAAEGYKSILDEKGNVTGYRKNIYCYPPIGTPDGGAYTTGADLSRFLRAVREGRLLPEPYARLLLSPHCAFSREAAVGVPGLTKVNGYALEFLQWGEETFCLYKEGCNDGVSAVFCFYPRAGLFLSLLTNQDCDVWDMQRRIQLELYRQYYK